MVNKLIDSKVYVELDENLTHVMLMPKVLPEYKEIAKKKIIQAAIKIFYDKGYHGATMDEIAEDVGVSKATLYTYFKNKEDILKAIWVSSNQTLIGLQKSFEGRDYQEVLEELYRMISESPGLHLSFEVTALSSHNENIKKINKQLYDEKLKMLKSFLQDQQDKGTIRDDLNPDVLAQILTALYTDVAAQLLIGKDESRVHENWRELLSIVLKD